MKLDALSIGAVAFAGFALWFVSKSAGAPIAAVSPQPAQRQRDAGLVNWLASNNTQAEQFNNLIQNSWIGANLQAWERDLDR